MKTTPLISVRLVEAADRVARGWPIGSAFVEEFRLPIIGPSSVALLRWLDRHAEDFRRPRTLSVVELSGPIGLGLGTGHHSPIMRTLERLVRYDAARWDTSPGAGTPDLAVFTHLFGVPYRLAERLPEPLQAQHRRVLDALAGAA